MYVSDQARKIEYLGNGVVNLSPGACCVWITDYFEQQEEDGYDVRGLPWRAEGHPAKQIFQAFGHWQIILPDGRTFDMDEEAEEGSGFFWDSPSNLGWFSEPRALPESGHWHWFSTDSHDGYRVHCSLQDAAQPTAGDTVEPEAAEG